jgi:hypothetical protein
MAEVHRIIVMLRRPRGENDLGAIEHGHYILEGETVILTDETGKPLRRPQRTRTDPLSRYERRLRRGEDAGTVARVLLSALVARRKRGSDFNRPLSYPPSGIV